MTSIRDPYGSRRKTMTRVEMVAAAADRHNVTEDEVALLTAWKDTPNNTLHYSVGGPAEYVVLYDTVIAARTGTSWRIETGGFNTATTRDRLNTFTPFRFHTEKGVMHIDGRPMHRVAVARPDPTL